MSSPSCADSRRPHSLAEAMQWGEALGNVDAYIREFLDEFYVQGDASKREAMLSEEPPLGSNERANAYVAAVAEHLAFRMHRAPPDWVSHQARFLKRPFFPAGLESLKATLLVESPTAFRRRLIFVGADPLYRPRRGQIGIDT